MSTMTALSRAEFSLLGRNRVLLFNAVVMPLVIPGALLITGRSNGGVTNTGVSAALQSFTLLLLVFVVFYNLLSVYATRRDELVLKRLRTGESTDTQILLGPAIPSLLLCVILSVVVSGAVLAFGGGVPVNVVLVALALAGGAVLFAALALITSAFTRNAEAAQITSLPVVLLAMVGTPLVRAALPDALADVVVFTPLAAVMDLINLGWFGNTTPSGGPSSLGNIFAQAGRPALVMVAWIAGCILIARTHFRWEPRS